MQSVAAAATRTPLNPSVEREGRFILWGSGMDILSRIGPSIPRTTFSLRRRQRSSSSFRLLCSRQRGDDSGDGNDNKGEKSSTDWDKAWSTYRKRGRKTPFSEFAPDKYVSWNPKRSNYPLSEEVDPIKRIERSNLMLWTSPRFTLVGAIIIVTFLLVYTILAPVK